MDDILFDIQKQMGDFIQKNGKDPEKIYLGDVEWDRLKLSVKPYLITVYPQNKEPEIYNMKIYIVNRPSHLCVA